MAADACAGGQRGVDDHVLAPSAGDVKENSPWRVSQTPMRCQALPYCGGDGG
jgi:hypothetical protein